MKCEKDIENFYFHENCVYTIFEHLDNKIEAGCVDKYSIVCEMCNVNNNIGFDTIEGKKGESLLG